jgi:hypothetical protein
MASYRHGGGCCGIHHSSAYSYNNDALSIRQKIRGDKRTLPVKGMLLEVVVTDPQLISQPNLGPILADEGFVLVRRFRNPNSRNPCNVFHFSEALLPMDNLPFSLDPEQAPKPPAPAPVPREAGLPEGYRRIREGEGIPNSARLMVWNRRLLTHGLIIPPFTHYANWNGNRRFGSREYRLQNLLIQIQQ